MATDRRLFQIEAVGYSGVIKSLEKQIENEHEVWKEIVSKHGLRENNHSKLASA